MKMAIVGYGKMGRLVESLAPEFGFEVAVKLDEWNNPGQSAMTPENFQAIDVAIEFSTPEAAVSNLLRLAELGVNTVVGTTGWDEHRERVREAVEKAGTGLVWSPNYSIGVNIFFRLVSEAARLVEAQDDYEAWGWEIHHSAKKDAPSGTMVKLVDQMRRAGYQRRIDVAASRAGAMPGTHEIGFDSSADTITLRHTARNREGFARGALKAAQWIHGRKGFFEFAEVLFA